MYFYIEIKNDIINPVSSLSNSRFAIGAYGVLTAVGAYNPSPVNNGNPSTPVQLPLNNFSCTWEICSALFYSRAEKTNPFFYLLL